MMKWHDAKKELPPVKNECDYKEYLNSEFVFVHCEGDTYCTAHIFECTRPSCAIKEWRDREGNRLSFFNINVTHWCYLDDIPKPKKDE